MSRKRIPAYAAIYLLWGGAYLAVRILVQEYPPFFVAGVRYMLAAVCLAPFALAQGTRPPDRDQFRNAAWTGVLMLACGYGIVFWAQQRLPSWMAAVLVSTSLLWTYLGECIAQSEFRIALLVPLMSGLAGIPLLVWAGGDHSSVSLVAAIAILFSACCWAAGTVALQRIDLPDAPMLTACIQFGAAGCTLLAISGVAGEWRHLPPFASLVSWRSLACMFYLVVGASLLATVAYLWLLQHEPASRVATFAYVNPLVAMVLGVVAAKERFSSLQLAGALAVLASVVAMWVMEHPRRGAARADWSEARER